MLFDDMLGNTLGVKDGEKFSAIDRDAFGELKPGEKPNLAVNFFTGKPEIDGLGYSFLFRNYRADLGKWQTTDPLGYPDGWNNLAYVNNCVTMNIDWMGGKIIPKGSSTFNSFVNKVVNTASNSNTTAGKSIKELSNHEGGGFMDRNSTVVKEYNGGQWNFWPTTDKDNLGGSGANINTGIYTYEFDNGTRRDPAFALLHELLHAYDINISGNEPTPGGDPENERRINDLVTELMNDPAVKDAFQDILKEYPSKGIIRSGVGLVE
ncbi:MAG: hypothetical protein DBX90_14945 [Lentisphaerae bacterium]|nr:MAG: hypothetical protein DBX90_14945 [Lentisphaerota bacterium]